MNNKKANILMLLMLCTKISTGLELPPEVQALIDTRNVSIVELWQHTYNRDIIKCMSIWPSLKAKYTIFTHIKEMDSGAYNNGLYLFIAI